MELTQKTWERGVLFVDDAMVRDPKSTVLVRVDKAQNDGHNEKASQSSTCARVAELADALASGASDRKVVEVRVLSRAPNSPQSHLEDGGMTGKFFPSALVITGAAPVMRRRDRCSAE